MFQRWQQRFVAIKLPTETLELQCQACGAKVLLYPKRRIRVQLLFGYLMIPAIVPSIIFFVSARRKQRAWIDNPIVEGASWPTPIAATDPVMPLDQRGTIPPKRRCECTAPVRCAGLALKGNWTFQTGAVYAYQCSRCSKHFNISSLGHLASVAVLASVLSSVGALIIAYPPGAAVGAEQSNRWFGVGLAAFGVGLLLFFAHRLRVRLAHPIVP